MYSHLVAKHGAEKEFECGEHNLIPGCGGKFASVLHLRKHQLTCGVKEKQHICEICQKGYMKKENLVHHIKVIHIQEKDKLQCNLCGKTYQSKNAYENHYKSNCIKRYEAEEEITPQMMLQAELMVRAQAQNLIQGLNTPIPTMFQESVMELSQNLFRVDCLGRVDYTKQGGLHEMGRIFREMGWQGRLYKMGRIT